MKTYSKKSKYFKIISFFLLSRKNFLLKTRGAKSFAGRIASHFASVVATCSREPILQIAAIFFASNMAARALSRCNRTQWVKPLSYTIYLETALLNTFGQKSVIENMADCDVKRVTGPYFFSDDR